MSDPEQQNAIASAWMKRGIALLNENTTQSLTESLHWFEQAIELRRSLPLHENSWYCYVLAAGWMNRGDALTRLGSPEDLGEAVCSYDEALTFLRALPLDANPLFRTRLAVAWMNRGITLQEQETPASLAAALKSFDEAIAALRDPLAAESAENRSALACAWMNRGNALLRMTRPQPIDARESAEQALALISDIEEQDLLAAETGLKARHILCRAIASQLADTATTIAREDLVAAATDAVDDGMKLARLWESRGESRFRDLLSALFRFGARAYQMHQPHFLMEFLLENLDPARSQDALRDAPEMHAIAGETIQRAFGEIQRDGFRSLNTPGFDRLLETLRHLRVTQARLEELRVCDTASATTQPNANNSQSTDSSQATRALS